MNLHRQPTRIVIQKATLGLGFVALVAAIVAAHAEPATSYETSIYRATPGLYWAGLAIALGVSLLLTLYGSVDRWLKGGTFTLAYVGFASFIALPVIRGYHYLGAGDSLTHLGWVKDFADGTLDPSQFLYPGLHLASLSTSSMLGVEFDRGIQIVVAVYFWLFLLFVPLSVQLVSRSRRALCVGLFSAGLFLPVNNVAVFRMAFPFGQAVMFFPLVVYLLFRYGRSPERIAVSLGVTLTLASFALVLVHPQLGVGMVAMFLLLTAFQHLYRRWPWDHPVARYRSLAGPTVLVSAFYLIWVGNNPRVNSLVSAVVSSLRSGTLLGDEVPRQADSAAAVGTSFEVMAFKLFFVSFVYSVIAGVLMVSSVTGHLDGDDRNDLVLHLSVGSIPLFVIFAVLYVSNIGNFHFRYLGAIMVVVTILGAIAVVKAMTAIRRRDPRVPIRTAVALLFAILVPLSLATVYFSPYILRGSGHVTEQRLDGYEVAFEQRDPDVTYVGIRRGPYREAHAVYGTESTDGMASFRHSEAVPPPVFNSNLSEHYERPRYLPITTASYVTEVQLYDGFRHSKAGFLGLDTTPGIDRVQSNGEFRLYLIENRSVADG